MQVGYRCRLRAVTLRLCVLAFAINTSSAFAQQVGHWMGTNSFGNMMSFDVSKDGWVRNISTGQLRFTCPSGAQPMLGVIGLLSPIVDGTFRYEFPVRDGDSLWISYTGTFTSDTEAEGNSYAMEGALRVQGKDVDSQLCDSSSSWTATWQSGDADTDVPNPPDGNAIYIRVPTK